MTTPLPTPKVFISYSWTDQDHVDWVASLATRLVNDGVDVVVDHWDLVEGQDKFAFMERMVTDETVTKVLAICDRRYAEKANGRLGGVGTESQIISKEVYDKVSQDKFIPIIRERDDDGKECVPVFFGSRIYIDFSDDNQFETSYDKLIRNLFGKPERVKPKLGKPPSHLLIESAPVLVPAQKLDRLRDGVLNNKRHVQALVQDYLETFLGCMEEFRITQDPADFEAFDKALDQSIAGFAAFRDNFVDFIIFSAGYLDDAATRDKIASFLESLAPFKEWPVGPRRVPEMQTDNFRFVIYELFLYLIATLIRKRSFDWAAYFIERRYFVSNASRRARIDDCDISVFNDHIRALDGYRNEQRKLNRLSVTADVMLERATNRHVNFRDILQADYLLFIREFFPNPEGSTHWYPRCAVHLGNVESLEIFARVGSAAGVSAIRTLLKVKDLTELALSMNGMFNDSAFKRVANSEVMWMAGAEPAELLNLNRILDLAQKLKN